MRHAALLLLAFSALVRGVAAQDTLAIDRGERVRLTLGPGGNTVVGVLVSQDCDSLRLQPGPDSPPIALARAGVTRAEASLGSYGHAGSGALVGLVFGGALGAVAGASCDGDFVCPGPGGGALVLGGTGLVLGALIGVFVRGERWERVYPAQVAVSFVPLSRGAGVGVSLRF